MELETNVKLIWTSTFAVEQEQDVTKGSLDLLISSMVDACKEEEKNTLFW